MATGAAREPAALDIQLESGERAVVVHTTGEVDMSAAPVLSAELAEAIAAAGSTGHRQVVVDLLAVTFFGSSGLAALSECHERAQSADVTVSIVAAGRTVLRPITITGLDRVIPVHSTLDEALRD